MKEKIITLFIISISSFCFSQNEYKKIYKYDEYKKDWALVKTISGTYGFIDRNKKTVVQPIYEKIEKFSEGIGKYALVKSVSGSYGYINRNGREVIPAIYWTKRDAIQQLKTLKD
jgi:DUF438 domain-containing protein